MQFYIDLLQRGKKSRNKLLFGIAWIILGLTYFISKIYYADAPIELSDWIFSIGFILLGIFFIFQGIGKPLESFLGKAFLSIDDKGINIKKAVFENVKNYPWNEITAINFNESKMYINNLLIIDLIDIRQSEKEEIKDFIAKLALEKGIEGEEYNIID